MELQNLFENQDEIIRVTAGDIIFEEGETGRIMYVILDGEVEIRRRGVPFDVNKAGDVVGEMALIDSSPRSATAVAKTDCRLASVDEKQFLYMVQQTPFFALKVMKILADRLRKR